MIVYPIDWASFGTPVTERDIDRALRQVVKEIPCVNVSLSGGVDSCLLLSYVLETKGKAVAFTVANAPDHPDIVYSRKAVGYFQERYSIVIPHREFVVPSDLEGDSLVAAYYGLLRRSVRAMLAGDGIDELAGGYYDHVGGGAQVYEERLARAVPEHLQPLDKNSGDIAVYLPYLDTRVASLFLRMPLREKLREGERKSVIMELAQGRVPTECIERRKYGFATSAT